MVTVLSVVVGLLALASGAVVADPGRKRPVLPRRLGLVLAAVLAALGVYLIADALGRH